jgi:hypothetical protein
VICLAYYLITTANGERHWQDLPIPTNGERCF